MQGVKFNGRHTDVWGLILTHYAANVPQIKEHKIDVLGRDGELDFTDFFGGVKYENRQLDFNFMLPNISPANYAELSAEINDALHGQNVRVEPDAEPLYYYEGRASVESELNGVTADFKITINAKPYKLKKTPTRAEYSVSGSRQITLQNSRRAVVPNITTTATFTIAFSGQTYGVPAGSFKLPDLVLQQGANVITATGTGKITFEYTEGRL